MSDPAIRAMGVSKSYALGRASARTLRAAVRDVVARGGGAPETRTFWALADVSFDVAPAEVVGIIGRNGAGKSTLLKVLSRITPPTSGRVELRGRVASLLEVGTGFHPDLTGRENVFMNGALLGMKKPEVAARLDEIVAFAEVEEFLDLPLRHYSSGMYMRLAFSVAAHLEPEILIVDEVLAVGDAAFQRKCLAKVDAASQAGRTVLLVSHDMAAITRLCKRALLIEKGRVTADGPAAEVASQYVMGADSSIASRAFVNCGDEHVRLVRARVVDDDGKVCASFDIRSPVHIEIDYEILKDGAHPVPNLHVANGASALAFVCIDTETALAKPRGVGRYRARIEIPGNLLTEGGHFFGVALTTFEPQTIHVFVRDAVGFYVVDSGALDSARGPYHGALGGVVRPLLPWTTTTLSDSLSDSRSDSLGNA